MNYEEKAQLVGFGCLVPMFVGGALSLGLGLVVTESVIPSIGIGIIIGVLSGITGGVFVWKLVGY
jgi:hypothetical protein